MRDCVFFALLACAALLGVAPAAGASQFDVKYGETYVQRESGALKADVYIPKAAGLHPGVIVVHGGAWHMGTRAQLSSVAQRLAKAGFTAVAISYRLAPQHKFPAQIEDCKAAVRWMRENAEQLQIDPERIGGFGYSAGAHLVALLGATDPRDGLEGWIEDSTNPHAGAHTSTRLQAVAGGGTPSDFRPVPLDNRWLSFWLGGTRRELPEVYRRASPAAFASADDPPMFFFHGESDELVPLESTTLMVTALKKVGVRAELYVAPKLGHNFTAFDQISLNKSIEFLKETLELEEPQPQEEAMP